MKQMGEKLAKMPSGILMYTPRRPLNMPRLLGVEFATELLESICCRSSRPNAADQLWRALYVCGRGRSSRRHRHQCILLELVRFSKRYTAAYMFIQVVGFMCVGLVAALMNRNKTTA